MNPSQVILRGCVWQCLARKPSKSVSKHGSAVALLADNSHAYLSEPLWSLTFQMLYLFVICVVFSLSKSPKCFKFNMVGRSDFPKSMKHGGAKSWAPLWKVNGQVITHSIGTTSRRQGLTAACLWNEGIVVIRNEIKTATVCLSQLKIEVSTTLPPPFLSVIWFPLCQNFRVWDVQHLK